MRQLEHLVKVVITLKNAPRIPESQLAEIDAIRREKGRELCIEINIRVSECSFNSNYDYFI